MSKSLAGDRRFTSLDLVHIAELGGVTVDWLLGGEADVPSLAGPVVRLAKIAQGLHLSPQSPSVMRDRSRYEQRDRRSVFVRRQMEHWEATTGNHLSWIEPRDELHLKLLTGRISPPPREAASELVTRLERWDGAQGHG